MKKIADEIITLDKSLVAAMKSQAGNQSALANHVHSISKSLQTINEKIGKLDIFYHDELPKRYGFDKDKMYYIGAASGYTYTKPINDVAIEMIKNLDNLSWREVQSLNKYFINGTQPKRRAKETPENS